MIRIKYIILSFFSLTLFSSLFSQDDVDVIILDQVETGTTHTHVAREKIVFKPGYEYAAQQDAHVQAYIDAWLSETVPYTPLMSDTDFSNQQIDESLPVGYTVGSHAVTPSGGASYSIPIFVSPGTNGMQPDLGLVYNSQSGEGIAGMGWNISGLSMITRVGKTIYHDGKTGPITLSKADDRFSLDGQRLIKESGAYGENGVYKTEMEDFSRITAYDSDYWGPQRFKVETKDGLTMWYGQDETSNANNNYKGQFSDENNEAIIFWRLVKVIDLNGNYMEYHYENSGGESRIKQIKYTGNVDALLTPYNEVNFYYNHKDDDYTTSVYVAGSELENKHLLRKISIVSEDELVKEYEIDYGKEDFYFLQEIKETSGLGRKLNSTIFKYNKLDSFTSNSVDSELDEGNFPGSGNVDYISGDFNGDGRTDLLVANKQFPSPDNPNLYFHTTFTVHFNELDGWREEEPGSFPPGCFVVKKKSLEAFVQNNTQVADFNGDGRDDLVVVQVQANENFSSFTLLNTWMYYSQGDPTTTEGESFSITSIPADDDNIISNIIPSKFFHIGDFNGDGASDFLSVLSDGGSNKPFITYPKIDLVKKQATSYINVAEIHDLMVVDFNGDGKSDLMWTENEELKSHIYEFNTPTATSVGSTLLYYDSYPSFYDKLYPGDFNGDGKTDFLATWDDGVSWKITYSTGKDFVAKPFQFNAYFDINSTDNRILIADVNGDGKSDIIKGQVIEYPDLSTNSIFFRYLSTGNSFNSEITTEGIFGDTPFIVGNFTGQNGTEFMTRACVRIVGGSNVVTNTPRLYTSNNGTVPHVLNKTKNGFNLETEFIHTYYKGRNYVSSSSGVEYPLSDFSGTLPIVAEVRQQNGSGGVFSTSYSFQKATIHKEGKGFLGFRSTKMTDLQTGNYSTSSYSFNNDHFAAKPSSVRSYSGDGEPLNETIYSNYEIVNLSNGRYWPRMRESSSTNFITGVTSTTNTSYNNDGNVESVITSKGEGLETEITNNTYVSCGSWIPSCLATTSTTLTRGSELPHTREIDYTYHPDGNIWTTTTDPNTDRPITQTDTYNLLGLLKTSSISSLGLPTTNEIIGYDAKGFPVKKTSTNGDFTLYEYDHKWGVKKWETGITGLTTYFEYDDFGKLESLVDPLGLETTFTNTFDVRIGVDTETYAGNCIFYTSIKKEGIPEVREWIDELGRSKEKQVDGFNGLAICAITTYDYLGNVKSQTAPFYEGEGAFAVITTNEYYDYTNFLERSYNDDLSTDYIYTLDGGLFSSKATKGNSYTTTYRDASGKLVKTEDVGGTVESFYHSNGQLKETKVGGVVTSDMEYDLWGNRTILQGVNAGSITYLYNAYGQLVEQTNGNGKLRRFFYDDIGRVDYEEIPDISGMIDYEYETSDNGRNQLKKVTGYNNITKEYVYDEYGRILSEVERLPNDNNLELITSYTYDEYGRILTTTYPSGIVTVNSYLEPNGDNKGILTSVSIQGESTPFYTVNAVDAFGKVTDYTLDNNLNTQKTYNKYGMLEDIVTPGVQNLHYDYELLTGNMNYRQDNLLNLRETFDFDDLDRLTESKVGAADSPNGPFFIPQVQTYATNGNIDTKSDVGEYSYDAVKINARAKAFKKQLYSLINFYSLCQKPLSFSCFSS